MALIKHLTVVGGCSTLGAKLLEGNSYPNTRLRRPLRSLVQKFKKTCRRSGLSSLLGEKNVVSLEEYELNIRQMVEMSPAKTIFF